MNRYIFFDNEYESAKNYLNTGKLPKDIKDVNRFKKKYDNCIVIKDAIVKDNKVIVPVGKKNEVLSDLYNNAETTLNGRDRFYERVKRSFYGISREDVHKFLKNQETYQLHLKQPKLSVSHPIISYKSDNIHQADLIDMSDFSHSNTGYKYVLVVIDVFSKFVKVEPLKNKEGKTVATAYNNLLSGFTPKVLETDRGSEFLSDEFQQVLNKYHIKHILSAPYNPKSQAVC